MDKKPFFRKSDFLIIAVCLLFALIFFLVSISGKGGISTAVISADGEELTRIVLGEGVSETVNVNGAVITVDGNTVFFSESDCPDKTCVKTGKLSSSGQSSACVPNRVSVIIEGNKVENGVDIIAY